MSIRLEGKTAVVTGAGRGIGRSIVEQFAREGCRVWATSRSEGPLESLSDSERIQTCRLDVGDPDEIRSRAEPIGHVDVLVNCAGTVPSDTVLDCTEAIFQETMNINVYGPFLLIRSFLPSMLEHGGGSIINVASVLSSITSAPSRFAYSVSKAALIGMTKSVAVDFAGRGIRCNALCPGAVDTPGMRERIQRSPDPERTRLGILSRHPAGRMAEAEEIAAAAVFLAAEESAFMTGQCLVMDGGVSL
jgi:2-keto-3-deoxy-L-fuconate dehydrogenase